LAGLTQADIKGWIAHRARAALIQEGLGLIFAFAYGFWTGEFQGFGSLEPEFGG
jgi:hypothetical protein